MDRLTDEVLRTETAKAVLTKNKTLKQAIIVLNNNRPYILAVLITNFRGYSVSANELMDSLINFISNNNQHITAINQSINKRYCLTSVVLKFKSQSNFNKVN